MSQSEIIKNHLNTHGSITSWDAIMEYGITRLAAVIFILKKQGENIISEKIPVTTRLGNKQLIAKYSLA